MFAAKNFFLVGAALPAPSAVNYLVVAGGGGGGSAQSGGGGAGVDVGGADCMCFPFEFGAGVLDVFKAFRRVCRIEFYVAAAMAKMLAELARVTIDGAEPFASALGLAKR